MYVYIDIERIDIPIRLLDSSTMHLILSLLLLCSPFLRVVLLSFSFILASVQNMLFLYCLWLWGGMTYWCIGLSVLVLSVCYGVDWVIGVGCYPVGRRGRTWAR
jgi:hypothetical protein